ncbi:MAG: stage 0 sporulation protein, partial [Clostridia bacterium]|nr:stage 0 sporulation protein [Clostridia bacterium]
KYEQNKAMEERAKQIFLEKVQKNGLVMQLVDVEYTFDNSKLIFYFTADGRVDFRELVKDLASVFRTRIELRQIGVRDEAKLIGGLGVCGRPFCCKEFLPDFAQVSIKMAKEQNLSLSSAKISGSCGRLMCCLRFEHEVYETEYATFPKVDSIVETPAGKGVITESNFLTGKIKVKLNGDQNAPVKVFAKKDIKVVGMVKRRDDNSEDLKKLEE